MAGSVRTAWTRNTWSSRTRASITDGGWTRRRSRSAHAERRHRPSGRNRCVSPTGVEHPVIAAASPEGPSTATPAPQGIDGNTMLRAQDRRSMPPICGSSHFSSQAAARNYILNIMAQVSTIYENEVDVSSLRCPTSVCSPHPQTRTATRPTPRRCSQNLRNEWNAHQSGDRPHGGASVQPASQRRLGGRLPRRAVRPRPTDLAAAAGVTGQEHRIRAVGSHERTLAGG